MKDMRKRLFIVLALMVCGIAGAWAEEVTPEQAREIAQEFMKSHGSRRAAPEMEQPVKVSGLYIFNINNNGGYVIVSNDDQTTPILGFSDSGSIDPDNMPSNMRAWLQGYADEIAWLQKNGITTTPATNKARRRSGTQKADKAKLIFTTWDQLTPYNNMTPYYGVSNNHYVYSEEEVSGYSHCATGCVATAMAQVMYYHKWPQSQTQKIPAYEWKSADISLPELPATTFNWGDDYMLTNYVENHQVVGNEVQQNAIATLMKYCGYSVEMDYGPESGSNTVKVADALVSYFGYKNTTTCVSRNNYTYDQWIDLIYHEIANNRPVVYGGQSSGGGHEFVCDGYENRDGTDYFHINWGWSGQSDNFYVLSVLNPYSGQSTGGSTTKDGYKYNQDAVIGIQPSTGTGTVANITPNVTNLTINSMTLSHSSVVWNTEVTFTINITNNNAADFDGTIFLGVNNGGSYQSLKAVNFVIPARKTKNCVLEYTPTGIGTYNFILYIPDATGFCTTDGTIYASLPVVYPEQGIPTNLAVTNITSNSAQLSWTDNDGVASAWVVGIKADGANIFSPIDADENPFTLTGLTAGTNYTVKVRKSDNENWSPEFTFTTPATPAAYPVPENLTANKVTPTSALISWTGSAESYDVRYGVIADGVGNEPKWLQYDDEERISGIGSSTSQERTWGVMYPGYQVTGNKLTKVTFYKNITGHDIITIKIYKDGNNAPETPIATRSVQPLDEKGFQTVSFNNPISIEPGHNLWITLTETGDYPMAYCISTEPNNQWVYSNGSWKNISELDSSFSNCGWMIRGYIESESINPGNITWTTTSPCSNQSCQLTGLGDANNYVVQVRSNYGSDNYSEWVTATINKGLELRNNGTNNGDLIDAWNEQVTYVTLKGRTLFKDGKWNTICLPFPLTATQLASSPLSGAEIRTLTSATLNNDELTLNFTDKGSVTSITAGTPYLIKWEKANNYDQANAQTRDIKDPVFNGVSIDKTRNDIISNNNNVLISFKGTYTPISFGSSEEYKLLIGDNNMLYYPQNGAFLGACRAFFMISQGGSSVRSYVLNFGDDDSATGIIAIGDSQLSTPNSPLSEWYTLDGRRLAAKPTAKGIYIHEGRKVVIK